MANFYEKARTNYFKVKDLVEFKEFIELFYDIELLVDERKGSYALLFSEESGVPSQYYHDDKDEYIEVDFIYELSRFITDDSIVVIQAVGSENMRFVSGYAIAVNSKNEQVSININEIYELAKQKFGVNEISEASY
jgi:hypothetical protein